MGKFSFDKEKVIDIDAVEKTTDKKMINEKSSFKDKLKSQGSAFAKGSKIIGSKIKDNYKEYNKPENVLKRKKFEADKLKLDAQISKSKTSIQKDKQFFEKSKGKDKKDPFGFGGGGGFF